MSLIKKIRQNVQVFNDQIDPEKIDLFKAGGQCVLCYDDAENGVYETHSVCVYAYHHLSLERWMDEVYELLVLVGLVPDERS